MGLFGPPNIEKLKTRRDVQGLIRALTYKKDPSVRAAAAAALGEIGQPSAIEPLITALLDVAGEAVVHNAAHSALVKIGAPAVEPLIGTMRRKSDDPDNFVSVGMAVWVLGDIADKRAVEPLIAALGDQNENGLVRAVSASALGKIADARVVEPLVTALKDRDAEIRCDAAASLGEIADARAVGSLITALKDQDARVRPVAAEALGKVGDVRAIDPLAGLLGTTDSELTDVALRALAKIGAPAVNTMISALQSPDPRVRVRAADVLGDIRDLRVVRPLISAMKDESGDVRQNAAFMYRSLTC
jgi:HEAT repeat protein